MIYDILEVFKKEYAQKGDKLILDNYELKEGLYIRVKQDGDFEPFIVKKKNRELIFSDIDGGLNHSAYEWLIERDYYSSYLNSNKSFYDKKLHNINYLSLFVKMESFTNPKKLLNENAIRYQYLYLCTYAKFTKKQEKEILKQYEPYLKKQNRKRDIFRKYKWIKNHLQEIVRLAEDNGIKNYIKIFFDEDIALYKKESEIYYAIKIFNDISYSKAIAQNIYGLSDSNMGLNSKKPFLEHKNRKLTTPFMILKEDALLVKVFFDWLKFQDSREKYPLINTLFVHRDFRDKDLIMDFDYVPIRLKELTPPIKVLNHLKIDKIEDYELKEVSQLEFKIDELFYAKQLIFNYFNDDIKVSDFMTKELQNLLFVTKYSMINYFKKYNEREFYRIVKKYGSRFILNSLRVGYEFKAKESLNLKLSLQQYKGEKIMNIEEMFSSIKNKLDNLEYDNLNKEEFFFLSGQLANYLLAQKEQHQKKQVSC